ncbi:hypothetical protein KY385_01535 [Candidatus Parcubacteria bacterium]|nr:hypothetical protein [Candidatus Parcubacteria bacterium]
MGLFDRFRKKDDSVLPSEVDEYYKTELKNRRSSSVFMALLALIITLIIAAGLFYGIRTIYRTLNKEDSNTTTQQTGKEGADQAEDGKPEPTPGSQGTDSNGAQDESADSPAANGEDQTRDENGTPPAGDVPATGDSSESLPSTGDGR